jgi:hypothetical protein
VGCAGLSDSGADDILSALPYLNRIVLDPARLGVNLLVFLVRDADDLPIVIKKHTAGAGSALVYGCYVFGH